MKRVIIIILLFTYIYAEEIKVNTDMITTAHNDLRKKYQSPPLKYSKQLENAARKWAKKLQKDGCGMVHSHGKVGSFGENLYWASAKKTANTKDNQGQWIWHNQLQQTDERAVVQAWYDEVRWYDYESNSCEEGEMCGHYTQVIWNTTTKLGCAVMACDDRSQVWVCEYAPAGNIVMTTIKRDGSKVVERLKPY